MHRKQIRKMMKKLIAILKKRWQAETPRLYRRVRNLSMGISGCAVAINAAVMAARARVPEWFCTIYPYLVGVPAAIAFVLQFGERGKVKD